MNSKGKGEIRGFWLRQNDGRIVEADVAAGAELMKTGSKGEIQGFWPSAGSGQNDGRVRSGEDGYLLVGAVVAIFFVMLALSIGAASVAKQLKREREVEAVHRANEYVRAIRVFYRKNGSRYPTSLEQLENTNNQRFLRQRFADPLTGKADWRLIHLGENQTTVKGFFGQDLPGLPSGLGSAASMVSPTGSGSAFNNSGIGGSNTATGGLGSNATTTTGAGQTGAAGTTAGAAGSGAAGSGAAGTFSSSSSSSTGSVGLIIGIGSAKTGESIVVVNEQNTYETWEFLYDPRIEQLYAKASLFGGGISSGSPASSLGSAAGMASPGQGVNSPTTTTPTTTPPVGTTPPPF
jgi:hypothetical protein